MGTYEGFGQAAAEEASSAGKPAPSQGPFYLNGAQTAANNLPLLNNHAKTLFSKPANKMEGRPVLRRVDLEQPLRHPAQEAEVGGGMENMRAWRWVLNTVRFHDMNTRAHVRLAPPPSHTPVPNVPNNDKVYKAAVFLYNTNGERSERAKLAANLFRESLNTNSKINDVKLDNDTLHVKLIRYFEPLKIVDFQWVSVCKQGYSVTPPTHELERFIQALDSVPVSSSPDILKRMYNTIHHEINAHTWVPAREKMELVTKHPVLQVR